MSIQDRIAALNLGQVGRTPQSVPAPTQPVRDNAPPRPEPPPRPKSTTNQFLNIKGEDHATPSGNQPFISNRNDPPHRPEPKKMPPPMLASVKYKDPPPSLPPRTNSSNSELSLERRPSSESVASTASSSAISSHASTTSNTRRPSGTGDARSRILTVPAYDPSALPALPPKKSDTPQKRPSLTSTRSSSSVITAASGTVDNTVKPSQPAPTPPPRPASSRQSVPLVPPVPPLQPVQPPTLPGRRESESAVITEQRPPPPPRTPTINVQPTQQANGIKVEPTLPPPKRSALSWGMNKPEPTPDVPQRPSTNGATANNEAAPPPIPLSSRPNLAQLEASKPRVSAPTSQPSSRPVNQVASQQSCMKCRDFSGPDNHAARFPRQSIPSQDVGWLSEQLTSPFPSATDKARAIFTWLHHNVAYNTQAFFAGDVDGMRSTPALTISTGLAVCQGYAELFSALAMRAGLECIVIGGYGKGFGYKALGSGDPVPPFDTNHAWNSCKIDDGEWKLIEPCWGAGNVTDSHQFEKHFKPHFFEVDNNGFGIDHFPKDQNHHFRTDGRIPTWDQFMIGENGPGEDVKVYTGLQSEHGIRETGILPRKKNIVVRGASVNQRTKFQFDPVCPHWDHERHGKGKPYVFILCVGGRDGRERAEIPFQTDGRNRLWWLDLPTRDLGCAGQTVSVNAVKTIDGKDARGYTVEQFKAAKGRKSMSWTGVCAWQLV